MLYQFAKITIKTTLNFPKDKDPSDIWIRSIKRVNFSPAKFSRVSIFFFIFKKEVNSIETFGIKLISRICNLQHKIHKRIFL